MPDFHDHANNDHGSFGPSAVNSAPVLGGVAFLVEVVEGDAAVVFAPNATLADAEENFDGGTVILGGLLPADEAAILHVGTDPGQIGLDGANVTYGGTPIGIVSGGTGGVELTVTLNAAATSAAVQALIRQLTFQSTGDAPDNYRGLTLTVTDAEGARTGLVPLGGGANDPFAGILVSGRASPAFTDYDLDGEQDLAVGAADGTIRYFQNDLGIFTEVSGPANPFGSIALGGPISLAFGDVTGDGYDDLVIGTGGGDLLAYRFDAATGTYSELTGAADPFAAYSAGTGIAISFADVTGDGNRDLIVGTDYASFDVFAPAYDLQTGDFSFTLLSSNANPLSAVGVGSRGSVAAADIDGDWDQDLIVADTAGTLHAFRNDGGSYIEVTGSANPYELIEGGADAVPQFVDLDADGRSDLVLGTGDGRILAWLNQARPIDVLVTAVNDAPTALASTASLPTIAEDATSPAGAKVSDLFGAAFSDPDSGFFGVAVSGFSAPLAGEGVWQYNDGLFWTSLASASPTAAVLLDGDARIRFVPAANYFGTPPALIVHLVDDSLMENSGSLVDLSQGVGGATPYSSNTIALGIQVTGSNDAPTAALASVNLAAVAEDTLEPAGATVSSLFGPAFSDPDGDEFAGIAIVTNPATAAQGEWQYHNGASWTAIGAVSQSAALVLAPNAALRFVPTVNYSGAAPALGAHLIDDTGGALVTGTVLNVSANGGQTRFSAAPVTLAHTIAPVNDAPVATIDPPALQRISGEILVNTGTESQQIEEKVTALEGGGWVVTWRDFSQSFRDGGEQVYDPMWDEYYTSYSSDVKAQVFAPDGSKVGGEILVPVNTASDQSEPVVTALVGGGFAIAWYDWSGAGDSDAAIKARIFSATGGIVSGELQVNSATQGWQGKPVIAGLSNGGFVVAWQDPSAGVGGAGGDTSSNAIKAQVFTGTGTPVGGEMLVNTVTAGSQVLPRIATLDGGNGFVVVWTDNSKGSNDPDVRAQIFTEAGAKVGGEILASASTAGAQTEPQVEALAGGRFAIAWTDGFGAAAEIKVQVFSAAGAKIGSETRANTAVHNTQDVPKVTALTGGGFIVTWNDGSTGTGGIGALGDTSARAVKAQLYDNDGVKVGGEILVNTAVASEQLSPDVAALPDGGFVIVWNDLSQGVGGAGGDTSSYAVKAQYFSASGVKLGGEILVNTTTAGVQAQSGIVKLANGATVILWSDQSGANGDTHPPAIRAQVLSYSETATYVAVEQAPLNLRNAGLSVGDLDSGGQSVTVTLSVGYGTIQATPGSSGAVVTQTAPGTITITGTVAQINALLNTASGSSLTFLADTDAPPASTILTLTINDNGATGGGSLTASDTATIFITGTPDKPVVTDSTLFLADIQVGDPAPAGQTVSALVAPAFSDPDGDTLAGIAVTGNAESGQGTWQYFNGTVWVAVAAPTASDALVLAAGTALRFLPAAGFAGPAPLLTAVLIDDSVGPVTTGARLDVAAKALDPQYSADPLTIGATVFGANAAPVVDLNGAAGGVDASLAYAENAGPVAILPDAVVSDSDSTNFDGGKLTVVGVIEAGETITLAGPSFVYDESSNTMSVDGVTIGTLFAASGGLGIDLNANATPALIQQLLRALRFESAGDAPVAGDRLVSVTLTDGDGGSATSLATVSVAPANDAPDLTAPAAATIAYTEGAAPIALMQGVTLSDPDLPANYSGGSLTLAVSGTGGAIALKAGSLFSVSGGNLVYDDAGTPVAIGTVSGIGSNSVTVGALTAAATGARIQDLIDDFTYANAADDIGAADRTATLTLDDGNNVGSVPAAGLTDTVTQTLGITPVNDEPVIDSNGAAPGNGAAAYTENGSPAVLAPDLLLSDPDDTNIDGAIVTIDAAAAGDLLTIGGLTQGTTGTNGAIGFAYVAATGTLTLTGSASVADYQAALRQVAFSSTSEAPGTSRSIHFTANDGEYQANGTNVDLTIAPVNDAPAGANGAVTTSEDDRYVFQVSDFPFTDSDGHALSRIAIVTLPAAGKLYIDLDGDNAGNPPILVQLFGPNSPAYVTRSLVEAGGFFFVPDADQAGSPYTSFKFKVEDDGGTANGGANLSGEYVMTLNVTPDNRAPAVDLDGAAGGVDYFAATYSEGGAGAAIGNNIAVTDADSGTGDLVEGASVTISDAQSGDALSISGNLPAGITVDPTSTATMLKLTGAASQADYQAALALVRYSHTGDDPTLGQTDIQRTIVVTVTDGEGTSAPASTTVTIFAENDGPANTVPLAIQNVTEDQNLVFSSATGNAITVADPDAETGQHDLTVTLSVLNGRLTLATQAGLTSVMNDGTASVTLTGTAAEIGAALDGLVYRGTLNFEGDDTLTIVTSDNGWSGIGGAKGDSDDIQIKVGDDGFIDGDKGGNLLTGTPQRDTFLLQQGGDDNVSGLGSRDIFYFGDAFTAADSVDGGGQSDIVILQGDYSAGVSIGSITNLGPLGSISLFSGSNTVYGASGNDLFDYVLTATDDSVAAGQALKINGHGLQAGEDLMFDGSAETDGAFQFLGGKGRDQATGGVRSDVFYFGPDGRFAAGDEIDGGAGYDVVYLRGNYEVDLIQAGFTAATFQNVESLGLLGSADTTYGGGGGNEFDYSITWDDSFLAAGRTMTINGSRLGSEESLAFNGSDEADGVFRIFGGGGTDVLTGGAGSDLIYGGGRGDTLTGGAGNDVFRYQSVADSNSVERDGIQDFNAGDLVDLSRIDANTLEDGDQAFSFIGNAAFSNTAGELRFENISLGGPVWLVQGDTDGNGVSDFELVLVISPPDPIAASDFLL
ncbi:MAG TPA: FG-GAP-like repeat-containing protein [Allosphingosinicella sp.]